MGILRLLSVVAMCDALGTVVLGSWTRINGAGMTCPDWPTCHGRLIPSMADGTVWEWTHRLLAFLLAPLVLAVIIAAWRKRGELRFLAPAAVVIGALFVLQVLLGAATVHLSNSPASVVMHWGTGMAFMAGLMAIFIFAWFGDAPDKEQQVVSARRYAFENLAGGLLAGTALVAFATMCVGAYVSSSGAGLACLTIPGCAGHVVVYTDGQFVQMLHRFAAAGTLLCAVSSCAFLWAAYARERATSARVRAAATVGLGLVFVQVVLGLMNVALRLPMDLREAHAVNAALVFLSFVTAALFAMLDTRAVEAQAASAR